MKKVRLIFCIVFLFMLFSVASYAESAYVLMESSTGTVLESMNEDVRLPMASLTKVMTALVVINNADLDEEIVIDDRSAGIEGSSMYLKVGQKITLRDLLYGLMLVSGNDAATALAYHVGGSIDGFASLMNETAAELGLKDTYFLNPSGLYEEGHYTTARDFAKLTAVALENETFAEIVSTQTYTVGTTVLTNHNRLLRELDGCIGVKTGYTKVCGRCLASACERDGVRLICVTLNYSDDWNKHKALYEQNFPRCKLQLLVDEKEVYRALGVAGGHNVGYYNAAAYGVVIDGKVNFSVSLKVPRFIYANKSKGDTVGQLIIRQGGEVSSTAPLILDRDTQLIQKTESKFHKILQFILHLFGF